MAKHKRYMLFLIYKTKQIVLYNNLHIGHLCMDNCVVNMVCCVLINIIHHIESILSLSLL